MTHMWDMGKPLFQLATLAEIMLDLGAFYVTLKEVTVIWLWTAVFTVICHTSSAPFSQANWEMYSCVIARWTTLCSIVNLFTISLLLSLLFLCTWLIFAPFVCRFLISLPFFVESESGYYHSEAYQVDYDIQFNMQWVLFSGVLNN